MRARLEAAWAGLNDRERKLIALMGGEAVPWDGPALDGPDAAAHATRRAQEGYGFLIAIGLPSDDR